MAHFVLDSYALLAFFRNEEGGEKVEQLLNDAAAEKHELYLTCINAGEVYYISVRKDGTKLNLYGKHYANFLFILLMQIWNLQ